MKTVMARINFVLLTFLGSSMLHVLLFITKDRSDINEESFDDDSSDEEQVYWVFISRCVIFTGK